MDNNNKWYVKVRRFNFDTILRTCTNREDAEETAKSLNEMYQTNEYFVEQHDPTREPFF
jgi:hypothetical protein